VRILHVLPYYLPATEWGGIIQAVAFEARGCRQAGAQVEVFATNARGAPGLPSPSPGRAEVDGTPVRYFERSGPSRYFYSSGLFASLLSEVQDHDVVHLHGTWTFPNLAGAIACAHRRVPYVITPHGALDPWALDDKRNKKRAYMALVERHVFRHAALIRFTAEKERAVAPPAFWERSVVVPNAVPFEEFAAIKRRPQEQSPEVLILGRIHPMKGFEVLVPAMRQVLAAHPRARLVVVGPDEGGYRAEVARQADAAGISQAIRFVGAVDARGRAAALASAALLVAPSRRENFGMAIAEAMAAGLPVVVSEHVNIHPDITQAGAGLAVPLQPSALAGAIGHLLDSPTKAACMGESGRRLVRERYSPEAVGQAMLAAYRSVCVGRERAAR